MNTSGWMNEVVKLSHHEVMGQYMCPGKAWQVSRDVLHYFSFPWLALSVSANPEVAKKSSSQPEK